jgi:MFS family permease
VAAAYINELSKAHGRGRFFLMYEMIFPVGLMATGQIGAWLVPIMGWKIMFLIGGVPGLIITFLMARLPESPRWLISKGRLDEAEAIVKRMEASGERRLAAGGRVEAGVPVAQVWRFRSGASGLKSCRRSIGDEPRSYGSCGPAPTLLRTA